ncbi:MAG: 50S ribosomal protein L10 [Planctomycetota bacterium]|nr:50S ribosomal protein L10 [Planctomycetota bacterium]
MPRDVKLWMAAEVEGLLESGDVLVVGLKPMDAQQTHGLRARLREGGARLRMVHNRTSRFALGEKHRALADHFRGQTALALGGEVIALAKVLVEAAQKNLVELRGGFVEGDIVDAADLLDLAAIPDKPTLLGMLLSAVLGSARGLAVSVNGAGAGLARCLQARVDQAGGAPEEAPAAPAPAEEAPAEEAPAAEAPAAEAPAAEAPAAEAPAKEAAADAAPAEEPERNEESSA